MVGKSMVDKSVIDKSVEKINFFLRREEPTSEWRTGFFLRAIVFLCAALWMLELSGTVVAAPDSENLIIESASRDVVKDVSEVEITLRQGKDLYAAGRFADSAEKFKTAVTLGPDSEAAHYWLGKCMSAMGRLEEAVFHWEEVITIREASKARKSGEPRESIDSLAKLSIKDAESKVAEARKRLTYGLRFLEAGNWDKALAEFKMAKELDGSKSEYPEREGNVYMDKGLYGLAARSYLEAEARGGRDPWMYLKAAESLAADGCNREAVEVLRRGLTANPGSSELARGISRVSEIAAREPEVFARVLGREGREVIIDRGSAGGLPFGREYRLKFDVVNKSAPVARPGSGEIVGMTGGTVKGELLLTRVEERMSYCLVTKEGTDPVTKGDCVIISR